MRNGAMAKPAAPLLRRRRMLFLIAVLATLAIALRPIGTEPELFRHADKLRHVAAFALLTLLALHARLRPTWIVVAGLLAFGVLIEALQHLTPSRQADPLDVLGDLAGIVLGLLAARALRALSPPRASRTPPADGGQNAAAGAAIPPR